MISKNDTYIKECQRFIHLLIAAYNQIQNEENEFDYDMKALFQYLLKTREEVTFLYVKERFELSNIIFFSILLSFFYEIDSEFRIFFQRNFKSKIFTFYEVFVLYQYVEEIHFSDVMKVIPQSTLKMIFKMENNEGSLLEQNVILQNYVLKFLSDEVLLSSEGVSIYQHNTEALMILQDEWASLKAILQAESHVILKGSKGSGKFEILKQLMQEEKQFLMVDWNFIEVLPPYQQECYLLEIRFFAILENYIVVFQDEQESLFGNFIYFSKKLEYYQIPWILNTNTKSDVCNFARVVKVPTFLNEIDLEKVIDLWGMNKNLLEYQYSLQNLLDMKNDMDTLENHKKSPYVQEIKNNITLQDFLCEKASIETIHSMLFQIKHRRRIQSHLSSKAAKRGIQVVFHGPSGTGKTMLASIMANELEVPLYRINLAMINDKYIGESEKHLEEVFTMAEQENCILLFDEADVLFSKRVEVNSSNDRHANSATAFLLQRLETYQGIVVLTSNLIHNFDDAFLRRMRFIIRLGKPNKEMQKKKWCLELENTKLKHDLHIDEILAWGDLSLARIENVVVQALSFALEMNQGTISIMQLERAYELEIEKQGELVSKVRR